MKDLKRHPQALALLAALLIAAAGPIFGGDAATTPTTDPIRRLDLDLLSFDHVWQAVKDRHWDPRMGGLDWDGVRAELRPTVETSTSRDQTRQAIDEMLSRIGASHYALIPAEAYKLLGRQGGRGVHDGDAGVTICIAGGRVLVRAVRPSSPAATAGVGTGWEVLEVDGESMAALLERLSLELRGSPSIDGYQLLAAGDRLLGPVGATRAILFDDGHGQAVEVDVVLAPRPGHKVDFGHLPPIHVVIAAKTLAGGVGYIAFSSFLDPTHLMPVFNHTVEEHLQAPGLVIDLRGNGGGMGWLAMGMAGWLVHEQVHLGVMSTRETELKVIVNPETRTFAGNLAILVDGLSASASEMFAGGLQDLGRARVFGSCTAGAALPSIIERLANGDGFQCAFAHYVSAGGSVLEGRGITPDVEVDVSQTALLAGRDPVLEAALDWINRS